MKEKVRIKIGDLIKQKDELIREYCNRNNNKNNKRGDENEWWNENTNKWNGKRNKK